MPNRHWLLVFALFVAMPGAILAQSTSRADSLAARAEARAAVTEYIYTLRIPRRGPPSLEPPRRAARRLVDRLGAAVRTSPGDVDLIALRAHHLVSLGEYRAAEQLVAETCRTPAWWCSAMLGFARYNDRRFVEAEADFDQAMQRMSVDRRCLWNDLSHVLNDRRFVDFYRSFSCESRGELNDRIWWLADPLWAEPGNDRKLEHFSRWVLAEFLSTEVDLLNWRRFPTDAVHRSLETILRIGKVTFFALPNVLEPGSRDGGGISVGCYHLGRLDCEDAVGNHGLTSYLPLVNVARYPFSASVLDTTLAPHSSADVPVPNALGGPGSSGVGELYASRYGEMLLYTEAQVGQLLRNGQRSMLVAFSPRRVAREAAHYHVAAKPAVLAELATRPLDLSVVLRTSPLDSVQHVRIRSADTRPIRIAFNTLKDSAIVSIEATDRAVPFAARHRFAVFSPTRDATARVSVSDLIFFDPTSASSPASADEVLERMLPRSFVDRSEALGLFWELYGLRVGDVPEFELRVTPVDSTAGFLRSLAQLTGLASRPGTTITRWTGSPIQSTAVGSFGESVHTVTVTLASIRPGVYNLFLAARVGTDSVLRAKVLRIN